MEDSDLQVNVSDLFDNKNFAKPFLQRKSFLIFLTVGIFILAIVSYLLAIPSFNNEIRDLRGAVVSKSQIQESVTTTLFLGIPVLGFVLGLLISLIPYKKMKYSKKYLPFSLLIIFGFYLLITCVRVAILVQNI